MAQVNAQQFINVVAQLLQRPFGSRNIVQKLTVQQRRPLPVLKLKTGNRTFQKDWYSKKDWLFGSGVTEQCGALSKSSGSGPLFFANHVYRLRLPLTA